MLKIEMDGVQYTSDSGETILESLRRQGAQVSYSCRKGACQSCIQRLAQGEVKTSHAGARALLTNGHVLACVCVPCGDIRLAPPDAEHRSVEAEILGSRWRTANVIEIDIAPNRELKYSAGQHIEVILEDGLIRPYSIVSLPQENYFFTIQVRHYPGSGVSHWLAQHAAPGQRLQIRGPSGDCWYQPRMRDRPMLMLATGVGAGALLGITRDALEQGHVADIYLYHGVRGSKDLYLEREFRELQTQFPQFRYGPYVSGNESSAEFGAGRILPPAFDNREVLSNWEIFLCGNPDMVEEARHMAIVAGARRERIHADPFLPSTPGAPNDAAKIAGITQDPALWAELKYGPGLTEILTDFYGRVYADDRLAPFFQHVTVERAVRKQYEFLADLFSGKRNFFGMNPYNAHHWMVISDELFDYREALFERVLGEHGLSESATRRWLGLHELFRAEIVKHSPRGIFTDGVEQPLLTDAIEHLEIDTVCDACGQEIPARAASRYHYRTGELHCGQCAGIPPH